MAITIELPRGGLSMVDEEQISLPSTPEQRPVAHDHGVIRRLMRRLRPAPVRTDPGCDGLEPLDLLRGWDGGRR
ncbi:hypothetical protein [Phyllobacterium sp. 0TCS1.6A]|uniref:hypothetical protein n=1 Tax=Phyllobacterium sp. 0TCS1.6A TaxID=2995637 RepID=UPI002263E9AF|nr:hypothetical protein [Phyllobacterium sp. 0TCS1.6A]